MKQYNVTGMTCAACSNRVEKAVSKVFGVKSCSVSLLTNSMGVEGTASDSAIIEAVEKAGYGASVKSSAKTQKIEKIDELKDTQTPILVNRLISSIIFLIPLMYFSMGHAMFGFPLPSFFDGNHVAMGLIQMIFAAIVMVINQRFFVNGFRSIFHRSPNMDSLVALGSSVAFCYSVWTIFAMTNAQVLGNVQKVESLMHEFYFETSAMILTLITVGKMLESRSKGKTTDALKSLMNLSPKNATILENGEEKIVKIENVKKGDVFVVRPGENIPVDGIVLEGESAVNESTLTGESVPVDKTTGDKVSAATINNSGFLKCEALRVGEDTTISQIIQMVSDAAATKAPIAKIADKVSGIFVPTVILISIFTFFVWLFIGKDVGFALTRAVAVLVISCPCALGLATPVAIMVGNGLGAKNGILFKTASSLEEAGKIQTVLLDKTGTITKGEPSVTDIIAVNQNENELLQIAFSIEKKSEHPLAKAIIQKATEKNLIAKNVENFVALAGNGLSATIDGKNVFGGSLSFIEQKTKIPDDFKKIAISLAENGKTPLLFLFDEKLLGIIAVADTIKEDSPKAIKELQKMGIRVVMLTGDNEKTANAIGKIVGVDEVIAGVLPNEKGNVVSAFKEKGKVCMVGDGINDAVAISLADTGIAIGAGTDIAIDSADVVLMKNSLCDVPAAIRLSKATLKNIHQNLFWAFFYNIIGIPLAAGAFGFKLNPMFGAAAMSLSSFCVVSNALRLNFIKIYNEKIEEKSIKEKKMEKTILVNGMMCEHCENHVKKALESLDFVESANANHKQKCAVVSVKENATFDENAVKSAIKDAGYDFVGVK